MPIALLLAVAWSSAPVGAAVAPAPWTSLHPEYALAATQDSGQKRKTLEEVLEEVRVGRSRLAASLQPDVERIIGEIDGLRAFRTGPVSESKKRALVRLGPDALPLLVPYADPGEDSNRGEIFRAELVGALLREHPAATTTDLLLGVAVGGTLNGRLQALHALETTVEPRRVAPQVIEIAQGKRKAGLSQDEAELVIEAAFRTASRLEAGSARQFIQSALMGGDEELQSGALAALADAPADVSKEPVLKLLMGLENPAPLASSIAIYYDRHALLLDDVDHARAVAMVAVHPEIANLERIRLFDVLREMDAKVGTPIKRRIEPFMEASRPDVRRAAQKVLARMKDRGAKRALLKEFDERVDATNNSVSAHTDRALVLHEIGEWSAAVKDWRFVMGVIAKDKVGRSRKEPYLGIARSLARQKKFREAADYLSQAPISIDELRALAQERDFADMLASRYGEAFHVPGDD